MLPLECGPSRMWPLARAAESHRSLGRPTPSKQLIIGTNTIDRVSICLSVVPVYVGVGSWSVATFALLDPGSQGTLLTDEMSCRLNLTRKPSNVHVSTFHGHDPSLRVCSLDFVIRGRSGKQQFNIKGALVVPSLNLSCRTVDWSREKNKWPHLKDLPLDAINYENVSVLIGADNIELIQRLALRKPLRKGEPFGVLTPLGWTVIGRLPQAFRPFQKFAQRTVNEIIVTKDDQLQAELEIYEPFWRTESFGAKLIAECRNMNPRAVEWRSAFRFVNGR
ncbi:hypothetical protein M514_27256, partial [Trichuris suis]